MNATLSLSTSTSFAASDFALKFYPADQMGLIATVNTAGRGYEFFYFPRARQLCVQGEGLGSFLVPVMPDAFYTFDISNSGVTMDGVAWGFDIKINKC